MGVLYLKNTDLSEEQLTAIDLMLGKAGGQLTQQEIADEVGVSRQTLYNWRKDPVFREELVKQAKTITDTGLAYSLTWMEQAMMDPKVKDSIKIQIARSFMQNKGMLKEIQESTVKNETTLDIEKMMKQFNVK